MRFITRLLLPNALSVALLAACSSGNTPRTTPMPATPNPSSASGAVTAEEIQQTPGDPIEKLLMTKTPGVWVGRTADGGIAVRIRGGSSLQGNNEPLYILDGVPYQPGPGGSLTGINPYDIASIRVLKEVADITMYGSRGANGVILITTKRAPSGTPNG